MDEKRDHESKPLAPLVFLYPLLFAANQVICLWFDNLDYVPEDEIVLPSHHGRHRCRPAVGDVLSDLQGCARASFVTLLFLVWFAYTGGLVNLFSPSRAFAPAC
jgi:hypothetical protein